MELRAQLTGRDGQKRPLRVRCQPEAGAGGELRGLLRGLSQLQEQVSALLAPLVEQESGGLAGAGTGAGPRGEWHPTPPSEIASHVGPTVKSPLGVRKVT
uniref:EKC/KEOPS complex subunit GON7 n=1 Tax=Chelydra serpentina TaxID=8475 RepID=A0A8C3SAW6_CHESE